MVSSPPPFFSLLIFLITSAALQIFSAIFSNQEIIFYIIVLICLQIRLHYFHIQIWLLVLLCKYFFNIWSINLSLNILSQFLVLKLIISRIWSHFSTKYWFPHHWKDRTLFLDFLNESKHDEEGSNFPFYNNMVKSACVSSKFQQNWMKKHGLFSTKYWFSCHWKDTTLILDFFNESKHDEEGSNFPFYNNMVKSACVSSKFQQNWMKKHGLFSTKYWFSCHWKDTTLILDFFNESKHDEEGSNFPFYNNMVKRACVFSKFQQNWIKNMAFFQQNIDSLATEKTQP